ncbi:MAG TPA: NAD(P)/FAD-dependent oxidoreductase [bacterium]|nr:NAD(P)/FAD-dependent oxidoreductase [bacterium]
MGGLTSAAMLAKAGLDVCVVEAARRPGGYLSGYERKGFVFDTAIHWLNECGPGGMVRRVFDFLGPGAPATPPLRAIRRYKGESFDYLLTDRPDDLRDAFVRDFPSDCAGIHRFFRLARKTGERMARMGRTMRSPLSMTPREKLRFGLPMAAIGIPMLRNNGATEKHLRRFFRSPELRRVFCTEERFLSVLVPIGWAYTGNYQQPPAGGSQAFPRWLCERIEDWGSRVALRTRATEIMLEGRRAVAVRVAQGKTSAPDIREIRCRHVVACGDVTTLYRDLLPAGAVPNRVLERLATCELYDSSLTLSIGLDRSPGELGFGTELLFLTRDGISRAEHQSHDPRKVALSVLAPSLRDPSMAPPGKGTLTVHMPARMRDGDYWRTGPERRRGVEYRAYKQAFADVVIDRVAQAVCPNLRDHIELLEVATPFTHYRYTGNRDGTIMANKPTGKNIRRRVASYRTPIDNLLLGGHWAELGGGVPGAVRAGANSALLVLQHERPAAFEAIKGLLDGLVAPHEVRAPGLRDAVPVA